MNITCLLNIVFPGPASKVKHSYIIKWLWPSVCLKGSQRLFTCILTVDIRSTQSIASRHSELKGHFLKTQESVSHSLNLIILNEQKYTRFCRA